MDFVVRLDRARAKIWANGSQHDGTDWVHWRRPVDVLIQAQESTWTELEALKDQSDGTDEPPDPDSTMLYLIGAIAIISLVVSGYLII